MKPDNAHIKYKKTRMKKLKKEDGFTLIEVLVALTIFAVGLLAVAAMQTSSVKMNFSAGSLSELNTWGMDKLEELMGLPYNDPWLQAAGNWPGTDSAGNTHQLPAPDGLSTVRWDVIPNTPTTNTLQITVTVTGKGKTLRFVSIKSRSL